MTVTGVVVLSLEPAAWGSLSISLLKGLEPWATISLVLIQTLMNPVVWIAWVSGKASQCCGNPQAAPKEL